MYCLAVGLCTRLGLRRCGVSLGTISVGPGFQSTCTMVCRVGCGANWEECMYVNMYVGKIFYMHHPTDRIVHIMAFVTPVIEHWL